MNVGNVAEISTIPTHVMLDDYYESLHGAYNSLREIFTSSGLSQDNLAERVGISKSRVSRVLSGRDNLTIRTLSHFGSAMECRLVMMYVPYDQIGYSNIYTPTHIHKTIFNGMSPVAQTPAVSIVYTYSPDIAKVETSAAQR